MYATTRNEGVVALQTDGDKVDSLCTQSLLFLDLRVIRPLLVWSVLNVSFA
jgi:hypothetical protein